MPSKSRFGRDEVYPARIIHETEDTLLLEVPKRRDYTFTLSENPDANRFVTLVFTSSEPWRKP